MCTWITSLTPYLYLLSKICASLSSNELLLFFQRATKQEGMARHRTGNTSGPAHLRLKNNDAHILNREDAVGGTRRTQRKWYMCTWKMLPSVQLEALDAVCLQSCFMSSQKKINTTTHIHPEVHSNQPTLMEVGGVVRGVNITHTPPCIVHLTSVFRPRVKWNQPGGQTWNLLPLSSGWGSYLEE